MKSAPYYADPSKEERSLELRTWSEFKEQGFLWFTNSILHVFGWAIATMEVPHSGELIAQVYRTKFRGFPEETNTRGYALIAESMKNNADAIYDEATKG